MPPRGKKSIMLAESVGGQVILSLCTERRALPASAVKAGVDEKIERYKQETGNERVGAKIKKEFKEEVVLDLLPRAFTKRSSTLLWIDAGNKLLVVGTRQPHRRRQGGHGAGGGARRRAGRAAVAGLQADPDQDVGGGVDVAVAFHARGADELHGRPRLRAEDARRAQVDGALLAPHAGDRGGAAAHRRRQGADAAGADVERPPLLRADRGRRRSSKIQLLDVVLDGVQKGGKDDDGFDTDAAIITGELSGLIPDLLEALGGEMEEAGMPEPA